MTTRVTFFQASPGTGAKLKHTSRHIHYGCRIIVMHPSIRIENAGIRTEDALVVQMCDCRADPDFRSLWTGRKRSLSWLQWPRSGFPVYQAPISYRESGGISARDQCELALDIGNDLMALGSGIETSSGASLTRVVPHPTCPDLSP